MPPEHPTNADDDDGGELPRKNHLRHHRPSSKDLLADLLSHNAYFDSVVNMIPARLYLGGSGNDNGRIPTIADNVRYRKGQHVESKESRRARDKRSKFDPDAVETTLETKRRLGTMEDDEGDDDDGDDHDDDHDDDNDNDDDGAMDDASRGVAPIASSTVVDGESIQYASRIEALRAKLRARVASLAAGGKTTTTTMHHPDGGVAVITDGPSPASLVSKRAARRAERRRRREAASAVRRGGRAGRSDVVERRDRDDERRRPSASNDDAIGTSKGRSVVGVVETTVAGDLATIDYQSLAGLRPKLDGALDNKSLGGVMGNIGKNGKRKSLERLLADAERKRARLRELKSSGEAGDVEKARDIEWGDTLRVAGGANLRKTDDPALLKKALKRRAKKKSASAKAWNSRVEKVKDAVAEKQRIRSHNLDKRKLGGTIAANLSSKRIVEADAAGGEGDGGGGGGGKDGKTEKRRRMGPHSNQGGNRAGFEGKKSGFINGKGGAGGGRGGGAS